MVEFVLVVSVLVPLVLAVLQIGVIMHVQNTLQAEAEEGARYAAAADRTPADGAARAVELARTSFGTGLSPTVTATREDFHGVPTVAVRITADLPLVGWLAGLDGGLEVTAHAVQEGA